MTDAVETMAYTNEVPWHGLGHYVAEAPSVREMLKLAQLDWKVERRPMMAGTYDSEGKPSFLTGTEVPGFAALTRDRDNAVLDVVGSQYTPIQNEEAFEFFVEFVQAGSATMETAGSLRGGRYVWGLANLNKSFKLKGKDEVKGFLLMAIPHQQGKSLVSKFTPVRVVCQNTLTLALRGGAGIGMFRMAHRRKFDADMISRAKEQLGIAREQMDEFEDNARALKAKGATREDTIRVLAGIYQDDIPVRELIADFDEKASRTMKVLLDIHERAPGADPMTAWGILNTVTYYSDHVASRTPDKRLTNAWMGRTALQKEQALKVLLEA